VKCSSEAKVLSAVTVPHWASVTYPRVLVSVAVSLAKRLTGAVGDYCSCSVLTVFIGIVGLLLIQPLCLERAGSVISNLSGSV